jgi:hypothetical protein
MKRRLQSAPPLLCHSHCHWLIATQRRHHDDVANTDHFPICSSFNMFNSEPLEVNNINNKPKYKINVNTSNLRKFELNLSQTSWTFLTTSSTVYEDNDISINIVSSNAINCFPYTEVQHKVCLLRKPLMTLGLLKLCSVRYTMYKQFLKGLISRNEFVIFNPLLYVIILL